MKPSGRRQCDTVEPENRLVARSLEWVWEEKLRHVEHIEAEHQSWRREQPVSLGDADRDQILSLGQSLPQLWTTATAAERKQVLRLLLKEVVLDQRREHGQVWIRIVWQTGATSGRQMRRRVQAYADYADLEHLQSRIRALSADQRMDGEIAAFASCRREAAPSGAERSICCASDGESRR